MISAYTLSKKDNLGEQDFIREGGDLIVGYLEQIGVEYLFGIPGGAIEPLYNAVARSARRGGLRPILARHETSAAFMADGYTRETGKLGVCCSTTGPGATNLVTGVACAYENEIPMLVITAQTRLSNFGKGGFQESSCTGVNTLALFQPCTRYNSLVSHIDQLERKLISAVSIAFHEPKGPVHLSIPLDILRAPTAVPFPAFDLNLLVKSPSLIDEEEVLELHSQIMTARKIVLVVGEGCEEAVGALSEFSQRTGALIVATPHGKGLIHSYHPQFRGVFGFAGHTSAREALCDPSVDVVLAVGTGLGEWASGGWDGAILNERLIHIDSVERHFARSPMARLHVLGRISRIFERLNAMLEKGQASLPPLLPSPVLPFHLDEEAKYNEKTAPIKPQWLMNELSKRFPQDTRYLADTGNSFAWVIHYLHPQGRPLQERLHKGLCRTSIEFAPMGWAIGGAVGTALASDGWPVVCITGDGSILMNGQELTVAVAEELPVIFVVLNDAALGMVKHGQRLAGAEPVAFELPSVDFSAYARAMGAAAHTIRTPQDLINLDVEAICRRRGPTLLDVYVDRDEVPPIGTRIKVLNAVGAK